MIESYYVDCTRSRNTITYDVSGRYTKTPVNTSILGYLSGTGNNTLDGGKWVVTSQYNFYTNDFEILENDSITYESQKYNVVSVPKNTAHRNHHMKVIVEKAID